MVGGASVLANQEVFRNLSMDSTKTNFVATVVNDPNSGSKLARRDARRHDRAARATARNRAISVTSPPSRRPTRR